MTGRDPSKSIFDGTDDIISSALSLRPGATLKQKSTCRELTSGYLAESDFKALISNLYDQIESNRSDRMPSRENWRLERQTTISHANRSPEVLLERAIAVLGGRGILDEWYNQISTTLQAGKVVINDAAALGDLKTGKGVVRGNGIIGRARIGFGR
jgi:hypothetical protein